MADITDRLNGQVPSIPAMRDGALEIFRLRFDIARHVRTCSELATENERLRALHAEARARLTDLLHELDTDDVGGLVEGQMEATRAFLAKTKES
ncbi:MAG: hypothetical protein K0R61_32 [Microvirga sp.]|jgi:hypothetical protein|nr:hypothetical protein [Microvirga sp.]MDF2969582.1 hypothetical protein [Microvirga sp.]